MVADRLACRNAWAQITTDFDAGLRKRNRLLPFLRRGRSRRCGLWFRPAIPRPAPTPALRNQASPVDKVSEPVLQGAVLERRRERLGDIPETRPFGVQGHRFLNGGQGVFRYEVRLFLRSVDVDSGRRELWQVAKPKDRVGLRTGI